MQKIKQKLLVVIGLFYLIVVSSLAVAKEPVNLAECKQVVIRYHDSGEYQADLRAVNERGLLYLQKQLKLNPNKKYAVVFDIDETALSNYPSMLAMSFGGTLRQMMAASDLGRDPAIKSTLALYNYAKQHNVAIFFITGRREYERAITRKNLSVAGYHDWNQLILRPGEDHRPVATWKTSMRATIASRGYDIVLNVGDQESDLRGGYADLPLKLPNPYYLIP